MTSDVRNGSCHAGWAQGEVQYGSKAAMSSAAFLMAPPYVSNLSAVILDDGPEMDTDPTGLPDRSRNAEPTAVMPALRPS